MPLGPIIVNSKTFNQIGEGRYGLSTLSFADPLDYFQIRGGQLTKDKGSIIAYVNRVQQKDVTVGGAVQRVTASVQDIYTISRTGFTPTEVDTLQSEIDDFVTASILNRIFAGES